MTNIRKILLVGGDNHVCEALAEQIAHHEEFCVLSAKCSQTAIVAIKTDIIDLVIIDKNVETIKILRNNGLKSSIIMLTNHDVEAELGTEAGANDCVTKPFRFAMLLARIRAHLRQHEGSEEAIFQLGTYSFRPNTKLLISAKGVKIRLTEKETAILNYLYRAGDKIVGRDVLLQEVWGYNANVTTHTLETHIYRLRQKIEIDPTIAKLLITEQGGYKLAP